MIKKKAVNYLKLNLQQLELISKVAAQKALEHLEREKELQEKKRHDRRLRNVKLLLRNYRMFANHTIDVRLEINELDAILELDELDTDEFAIESIKRSKKRTLAMVKFINKMFKVYKIICDEASNPEEKRRYQTVYDLYISPHKKTVKEIATCQNVDQRTVYRDIDKACEDLSALMFGVDSIRFS